MSFIVVDTEGADLLREIAVFDEQGNLVYEAQVQDHPHNVVAHTHLHPLHQVLQSFAAIAQHHHIVCHHAKHDRLVLKRSFQSANIPWHPQAFTCTHELAKQLYPTLPSHSLHHLSCYFNLQVNGNYFNPHAAHTARYDASFTYQLYQRLMYTQMNQHLTHQPNPFSSRVDTPFQDHPDCSEVYDNEFLRLKSIIEDIRHDPNHQSRGSVIIAKPGSGKTHLMMRLAKNLLKVNRLLFIRQPNNPDAILYHIYTRILESFIQIVPENGFTQLENLIAKSFIKIISTTQHLTLTQKDIHLTKITQTDPLNLYHQLGAEGSKTRLEYWEHLEKRVNTWWSNHYGTSGFSPQIVSGIVRYCRYSDPNKKSIVRRWLAAQSLDEEECKDVNLPHWSESISQEEFSLEAISVFSRLSLLDEPLIIIFDQLEGLIYNERLLRQFGAAMTELFTNVPNSLIISTLFPERWQYFQDFFDGAVIDRMGQDQIPLPPTTTDQLKRILDTKLAAIQTSATQFFTQTQLADILSQNSVRAVLNRASAYYNHIVHSTPLHPPSHAADPQPTTVTKTPESEGSETLDQRVLKLEQSVAKITHIFETLSVALSAVGARPVHAEATAATNPTLTPNQRVPEQSRSSKHAPKPDVQPIQTPVLDELGAYLKTCHQNLEESYDQPSIITDDDDVGRLIAIVFAMQQYQNSDISTDYLGFGRKVLPPHRVINCNHQDYAIGFIENSGSSFTSRIRNWNQLVISHPDTLFWLFRDQRHGAISGSGGKTHIDSLNNAPNGRFEMMDRENRLTFDLLYTAISDVQNQEVEFPMDVMLERLLKDYSTYWLFQILCP